MHFRIIEINVYRDIVGGRREAGERLLAAVFVNVAAYHRLPLAFGL